MTEPTEPNIDPAGMRGPGDPEAAKARQQHAGPETAETRQEQAEQDAAAHGSADQDAVKAGQPHVEEGRAGNIREEQGTHAAGTVPAAYIGSGGPGSEGKPEDAVDAEGWDEDV